MGTFLKKSLIRVSGISQLLLLALILGLGMPSVGNAQDIMTAASRIENKFRSDAKYLRAANQLINLDLWGKCMALNLGIVAHEVMAGSIDERIKAGVAVQLAFLVIWRKDQLRQGIPENMLDAALKNGQVLLATSPNTIGQECGQLNNRLAQVAN